MSSNRQFEPFHCRRIKRHSITGACVAEADEQIALPI
jgi:hypothetical protein